MSKPMKKMLQIVGIIFGLIFVWYGAKKLLIMYFVGHYVPPAVTISASNATVKNWQSYLTSVGTLTAVNGVDMSAEAPGIVKEIRFASGQFVNKGDVLVLLDTNIEQAQLRDNQAQAKLALLNYNRHKELLAKKAVSQSQLDSVAAQYEQAAAGVEQIQAKIQQKTITAPFSGKIGIRLFDLGQYVSAGTTLVTLQSLNPLYVQFNLPEEYLPEIYLQQPVEVNVNIEGCCGVIKGSITAVNAKVDQTTRNILIQATIPNNEFKFYPGMYALVHVLLKDQKSVVTLPQTSISYSLHGDSVFIIRPLGKDKKEQPILNAYRQYVKVGERRDAEVSILEGVKPGEQVVTSGQLKLQNGTHVVIDNSTEL